MLESSKPNEAGGEEDEAERRDAGGSHLLLQPVVDVNTIRFGPSHVFPGRFNSRRYCLFQRGVRKINVHQGSLHLKRQASQRIKSGNRISMSTNFPYLLMTVHKIIKQVLNLLFFSPKLQGQVYHHLWTNMSRSVFYRDLSMYKNYLVRPRQFMAVSDNHFYQNHWSVRFLCVVTSKQFTDFWNSRMYLKLEI